MLPTVGALSSCVPNRLSDPQDSRDPVGFGPLEGGGGGGYPEGVEAGDDGGYRPERVPCLRMEIAHGQAEPTNIVGQPQPGSSSGSGQGRGRRDWQQSEASRGGVGVYQSFVLGLKRPLGVIM